MPATSKENREDNCYRLNLFFVAEADTIYAELSNSHLTLSTFFGGNNMQDHLNKNLVPMKFGVLFALLTLAFGFGMGGAFGAFESKIKGHLKEKGKEVLSTAYKGDEAKMKKVTDKAWIYCKRAHLHANGLGAIALSCILLLSFLRGSGAIKSVAAWGLGLGGFNYSLFWLFAALRAPGMGSTGMAKESLKWLAVPSAGLCILGIVLVLGLAVISLFGSGGEEQGE